MQRKSTLLKHINKSFNPPQAIESALFDTPKFQPRPNFS